LLEQKPAKQHHQQIRPRLFVGTNQSATTTTPMTKTKTTNSPGTVLVGMNIDQQPGQQQQIRSRLFVGMCQLASLCQSTGLSGVCFWDQSLLNKIVSFYIVSMGWHCVSGVMKTP